MGSHFYGWVDSHGRSKTDGTRCGSKDRGMTGHISGWDLGGKVEVGHNLETELDWCEIYATGGSNRTHGPQLARLIEDKYANPKIYLNWKMDKLLNEEEYDKIKKDIGKLVFEGIDSPGSKESCNLIAEAIMDQLNFKLDEPKPEED